MAQQDTRLLSLMSHLGWRGVNEWEIIRNRMQQKHIPLFRQWMRQNLKYLEDEKTRDAIERYYLNGESLDYSTGIAMYLKAGNEVLWAVYKKSRDDGFTHEET